MMKEVNGQTRLCGLIGYPVKHTLSPVIHNYLAEVTKKNLVYVPFQVENGLDDAVKGGFALNVLGMNVTVPYKKDVMESLVEVDENARRIGAVNTLVRMENGYKGYNTDYLGLKRAMEEEGVSLKGEDVVVLGAGGAANAVVYLCASSGAKTVYILNRTLGRAKQLAQHVGEYFPETELIAMETADYTKLPDKKFVVIQTTSVGLHPNVDEAVIEDQGFYAKVKKAVDIIYNPEETKFMKLVKEQGGEAYNGLKMLLYQGVIAYELWNDVSVDAHTCKKVLELMTKKLQG